jgi:hypothetical protein
LAAFGIVTVDREGVLSRMQRRERLGTDPPLVVFHGESFGLGGDDAVDVDLAVLVVMKAELQVLDFGRR